MLVKEYDDALLESNFAVSSGSSSGFAIATGMWKWGGWQHDPEIGEVKFVIKQWTDGNNFQFKELKQRRCTE